MIPPRDDPRWYCLTRPLTDEVTHTSDGRAVPRYFSAVIDVPAHPWGLVLAVAVESDGSAVCYQIGSTRRDRSQDGAEWVHEVLLNLPIWGLRQWVQYAVGIAATELETGQNPLQWPVPPDESDAPESLEHWSRLANTVSAQATKRRKATTTARLLEVATIYNAAKAEGRHDPTVAVAEKLTLSRSQAAKLVMQCRKTNPPLVEPVRRSKKESS